MKRDLQVMTYSADTWTLTKQAQNKLAAAQTTMERSMLNVIYKDIMINIWFRKRIKVINILSNVRKMKCSCAGHINRLKDERWTSRVIIWIPSGKKIRQGRSAKRRRDDLDKYWSDTIWQRTTHIHTNLDTPSTGHYGCTMMMMMMTTTTTTAAAAETTTTVTMTMMMMMMTVVAVSYNCYV